MIGERIVASAFRRSGAPALLLATLGAILLLPAQGFAAAGTAFVSHSAGTDVAAPVPTAPANDPTESHPLKDVVLQWQPVTGARSYQVQISPNDEFTNNHVALPDSGTTANTSFDVPLSLPHASYFWRVRAKDGSGYGDWSASWEFLREWDANTSPGGAFSMLSDPGTATDAIAQHNPLFSWQPVQDASLYEVQLSTRADFKPGATTLTCWTAATSLYPYTLESSKENAPGPCFTASSLANGTSYYWRVQPWDDSTAATLDADLLNDPAYSCSTAQPECDAVVQTGQFTFQAPVAAGPLTAPVTGLATSWHDGSASHDCTNTSDSGPHATVGGTPTGLLCPTTPTLTWNPVPGANYYVVRVYVDPDKTNIFRVYNTPYTSLTPRDLVFDDQDYRAYFWTVEAGTCENSPSDPTCSATTPTPAPTCAKGSGTSTPDVAAVEATPAGQEGATSAPGAATVTVTLTGSGFSPNACVTPTAGAVVGQPTATSTTVSFQYSTPIGDAKQDVSFTVTNNDGAVSPSSPPLTVDPADTISVDPTTTSNPASFDVQTGAVTLSSPANGALTTATDLTFAWSDYLRSGGTDAAEARNYDLQIASDKHFDSLVLDQTDIDMTQFVDPKAGLNDGTYWWRVAPIDESNNLLAWSTPRTLMVDSTPPSVSVAAHGAVPVNGSVTLSSTEKLKGVVTGARSTSFTLSRAGGTSVSGSLTAASSGTSFTFRPAVQLVTGATYRLLVGPGVTDAAGNQAVASGSVSVSRIADDSSPAWKFSGTWHRHRSSAALGHTFREGEQGAAATVDVFGGTAVVYGCKAPVLGSETITVGGHKPVTVSLHSGFTQCGVVLWSGKLGHGVTQLRVGVTDGVGDIDRVVVKP